MGEAQFALDTHIAILLVHHTTKFDYDENVFDGIQGTTGITAGADTLMVFRKLGDNFKLHITGKDVIADELTLHFDRKTCTWHPIENLPQGSTPERTEILELLSRTGKEMQTQEIAIALDKKKNNVSSMLGKMVKEGVISNPKFGFYSLPNETNEGIES